MGRADLERRYRKRYSEIEVRRGDKEIRFRIRTDRNGVRTGSDNGPLPSRSSHPTRSCQCLSIKGQDTATYLVPRRVLDPVEWDHITVVSSSHIEACKDLGLVAIQVGGVPQLTRDVGKKGGRTSLTTRRRVLARGRHCVRISG